MKKFVSWLYYRIIYLPEMKKKLKEHYPDAKITVRRAKTPSDEGILIEPEDIQEQGSPAQYRQAERERKWISDDQLH